MFYIILKTFFIIHLTSIWNFIDFEMQNMKKYFNCDLLARISMSMVIFNCDLLSRLGMYMLINIIKR
jgi:hypothetical protein